MTNNDLMLQQCLSVLNHVSEQLAQLKRSADPLKVIDLVNMSLFTLFHEQKAFVNLAFQLNPDVRNCIKTIDDLIKVLIKVRDNAAMDQDLYTLIERAEQLISTCIKPIYESLHAVAEAKHGQPMAISIAPYRPWDDVAPPVSVLPRLIAESLRPKLTLAVKLLSGSPKDKKE